MPGLSLLLNLGKWIHSGPGTLEPEDDVYGSMDTVARLCYYMFGGPGSNPAHGQPNPETSCSYCCLSVHRHDGD